MAPSDDTHSDDGGCLVEDLDVRSQRPTPENRPSLFASRTRLLNGRGKRDTPPEVLVVASSGSRDALQVDARSEAGGPNQPHALGAAASSSSPSGPFVAFKRYLSGKLNSSSRADSPATSRSASKSGPHAIDAAPPMTSPHSSPPPDQERPQQALPHDEQPPAVPQSFAAPPSAVPQDLPAAGQFNRAPAAYSPFEVWCQASANGADDATLLSLAQATGLITTNTATGDVTLSPSLPLNPSAAHSPFSRPESMGPASVGLGHGQSTGGYPTHSPTPGSRPSSLFGTPASSSLMYSALAEPHSSSVLYPSSAAAAAPGANNPLFTLSFGPNSGNDAPVDAAPRMMLPSAAIPRFLPAAGASDDPVTPTLTGSTSNASAAAAAAASQFFTSHASSAAQPSSSSNAMLAGLTALGGPPPGTSSSAANLPMSPGASTGAGQQPPLSPDAASKSHPLYKTELCRGWLETGSCRYGSKCQFAHGHEELRPVPRHPKYKTELCRAFALTGTCSYGARCRFIHGTPGSLSAGTEFGPGQHVSAPLTGCGANMGSADEMAAALWHSTTTGRTGGMEPGMEGVETLGEPAGWSTLQQQPAYMGGAPRTSAPGSLLPGAGTSKPGDRTPRFFPGLQQRQTLLALLQQEAAMQAPQPPAARQHMSSEAAAMLSTLNAMTGISAAPGLAGGRASMDAPPMSPLESMLSGMDASGLMHMGAMGRMDVLGMQEAMRRASADESVRRMSMESLFQPPSVISGASQRMSLESAGNRSSMESSQSAQLWTPAAQRDAAWAAGQLASSQLQSAGNKLGWPSPTRGCAYDADVFGKADSLMPRPGVGVVGESKAHVARTGSLPAGPAAPYGVGQRAAGMRSASMRQPDAVAADSALLNQYLLTLAAQQQQQGR